MHLVPVLGAAGLAGWAVASNAGRRSPQPRQCRAPELLPEVTLLVNGAAGAGSSSPPVPPAVVLCGPRGGKCSHP